MDEGPHPYIKSKPGRLMLSQIGSVGRNTPGWKERDHNSS